MYTVNILLGGRSLSSPLFLRRFQCKLFKLCPPSMTCALHVVVGEEEGFNSHTLSREDNQTTFPGSPLSFVAGISSPPQNVIYIPEGWPL